MVPGSLGAMLLAAACSTGSQADGDDVSDADDVTDNGDNTDSTDGVDIDAAPGTPDAAGTPDAMPAPPDAACEPQAVQLLANPAFDVDPIGTGWTETLIDPGYPLITGDDGIAEHTAPYKAWMAGFEGGADALVQGFTLPATATALVLSLQHETRTDEDPGAVVAYDSAFVELTDDAGTTLVTPLTLSNLTATTAWTSLVYTFDPALVAARAGEALRLRFRTASDDSFATSFYFDSVALTATACP